MGSNALFRPLQILHASGAWTYMQTNIHKINKQNFKKPYHLYVCHHVCDPGPIHCSGQNNPGVFPGELQTPVCTCWFCISTNNRQDVIVTYIIVLFSFLSLSPLLFPPFLTTSCCPPQTGPLPLPFSCPMFMLLALSSLLHLNLLSLGVLSTFLHVQ